MFEFDLSDELKLILERLGKRDRIFAESVNKKIKEIVNQKTDSIEHYKNCKYDLKDYKAVYINKSFVLLFRVLKEQNFILFWKLDHHDRIYKRQ